MQLSNKELNERLDGFLHHNEIMFRYHLEWFAKSHPRPNPRDYDVNLPITFWMILSAAIAAATLSGFRVWERFYAIAMGSGAGTTFAVLEATAAVLAIPVAIMAFSIVSAIKTERTDERGTWIGLGLAVILSAVAGLGQAFKGLNLIEITSIFDAVLAFCLGAGVTGLEYFSGEMLGVELVKYRKLKSSSKLEFDKAEKTWMSSARSAFGSFSSQFSRWSDGQTKLTNPNQTEPNIKQTKPRTSTNSNKQFIEQFIANHYEQTGELIGFSELAEQVANKVFEQTNEPEANREQFVREFVRSKKGYISQVRTNWSKQ